MTNTRNITIAKSVDVEEISIAEGFSHKTIIDTRVENGRARPIEEAVLRKLRNHFVDYVQMPLEFGVSGPCQEVHLCETLADSVENTLVITDDLTQLSSLLSIYNIEFKSNAFYVVETAAGRTGGLVKR